MPTPQNSAAPVRQPEVAPRGTRIKVVGVGGGGSNAIDRMIDFGLEGVEFIALNTDVQALEVSKAPVRGQLGSLLTNGLSAGSDPNIGRRAAIQDVNEIAEVLEGADMVFVTAGLGGGTGTGAAPIIAAVARQMGALTVAIVTRPFSFEGKRRMAIADWGIDHLLRYVDTLIVIPNEKLLAIAKDAPFFESFSIADDFLRQAVQSITDIITSEGVINRDFADVKTTMAGMGYAVMGTASRSGPTRAVDAVMAAMESPLLEEGAIDGALGILINITGSSSLRLSEVNAASSVIQSISHEDANIIFGAVLDERLGDEVKVTVVATGFRNDGHGRPDRRSKLLPRNTREQMAEEVPSTAAEAKPTAPTERIVEAPPIEVAVIEAPAFAPVVEAPLIQEPVAPELPAEISAAIEPVVTEFLPHEPVAATAFAPVPPVPKHIAATQVELALEDDAPNADPYQPELPLAGPDLVMEEAQPLIVEMESPEPPPAEAPETLVDDATSEVIAVEHQQAENATHAEVMRQEEVVQGEELHHHEEVPQHEAEATEKKFNEPPVEELALSVVPAAAQLATTDIQTTDIVLAEREASPEADEEEDWLVAIREIARLAEPGFEVEAPFVEEAPKVVPQHATNTHRAAVAAYSAVTAPETEPEPDVRRSQAINAFAEVLEARRKFVDGLGGRAQAADPVLGEPSDSSSHAAISEEDDFFDPPRPRNVREEALRGASPQDQSLQEDRATPKPKPQQEKKDESSEGFKPKPEVPVPTFASTDSSEPSHSRFSFGSFLRRNRKSES